MHLWKWSVLALNDWYVLHSSYTTTINNVADYISQLIYAKWLVNLAGCISLYSTLKVQKFVWFGFFPSIWIQRERESKYCTNLLFLVTAVSYRTLFFTPQVYGLHALPLGYKCQLKNKVHNLMWSVVYWLYIYLS